MQPLSLGAESQESGVEARVGFSSLSLLKFAAGALAEESLG